MWKLAKYKNKLTEFFEKADQLEDNSVILVIFL